MYSFAEKPGLKGKKSKKEKGIEQYSL